MSDVDAIVDALLCDEEMPEETTADKFAEEALISEKVGERAGVQQPKYTDLVQHLEKYGPDGILESAAHLPIEQYDKLAAKANKIKFDKKAKKWAY